MIYKLYRKLVEMLPIGFKNRVKLATYPLWNIPPSVNIYVKRRIPILVFQMGKVGSSSVFVSLKKRGKFVIHSHLLQEFDKIDEDALPSGKLMMIKSNYLHNHIVKKRKRARIITLVRDPIAVIVSHFFQNLDYTTGTNNALKNMTLDDLLEEFATNFSYKMAPFILNWFDNNFLEILDVDIYNYPFPKEKGYLHVKDKSYELLIIKLEINDGLLETCVVDFLNIHDFKLSRSNEAQDKKYAERYKEFKQAVSIPQEILDQVYDSKLIHHFYTQDEIDVFRSKWQRS